MPRLWTDTIKEHRNAVRDATLDATAALVAEHGPTAVTMSQIAKSSGISRATLYKYFPDVDSILTAWHERQLKSHLNQLKTIGSDPGSPLDRLKAVLTTYALITHQHRTHDAPALHRAQHTIQARKHLHTYIRDLIAEATAAGSIRTDVSPAELATYCLHALSAASALPTNPAVHRLTAVTLSALIPNQES